MNIKRTILPLVALLTAGIPSMTFSDDSNEKPTGPVNGDNPNIGIKYDKKQGLNVTPFSAKLLNLQMADVEEKNLISSQTLQLRIFDQTKKGVSTASAWLPAADVSNFAEGKPVALENGSTGVISEVTKGLNNQAEVIVEIPAAEPPLKIGKFLTGTVKIGSDGEVVVVPTKAIIKSAEGAFAYVDNGGWTVRTPVETGLEKVDEIEIVDGLYFGDRIVTNPVMALWMTELQLLKSGKA